MKITQRVIAWSSLVALLSLSATEVSSQAVKLEPLSGDNSRADLGNYDFDINPDHTKAVTGPFKFPRDADDAVYGIDVSHNNGVVDWSPMTPKNGVQFVFIKATQGNRFEDPQFEANWRNSKKSKGLRRGAYHFLSAGVPGTEQAAAYIQALKNVGRLQKEDLRPVVDVEWDCAKKCAPGQDRWDGYTTDQIVKIITDWVTSVKSATGKDPIIYTSAAWWNSHLHPDSIQTVPVWIANYSAASIKHGPPSIGTHFYAAWQFTDHSTVGDGMAKFDANILIGASMHLLSSDSTK